MTKPTWGLFPDPFHPDTPGEGPLWWMVYRDLSNVLRIGGVKRFEHYDTKAGRHVLAVLGTASGVGTNIFDAMATMCGSQRWAYILAFHPEADTDIPAMALLQEALRGGRGRVRAPDRLGTSVPRANARGPVALSGRGT